MDIKDVAASLIEPTPEAAPIDETPDTVDAVEELTADTDDTVLGVDEEEPEEEAPEEASGPEEEIVTLTIDGEDHEVTYDELVQAYQIDGAARKRLTEATEARKTAQEEGRNEGLRAAEAEIAEHRERARQERDQLGEILQLVGPRLFASSVQPPDPAMEQTDPLGYLQEMERYRAAQSEVQGFQQTLVQKAQEVRAAQDRQQAEMFAENRRQLLLKRPELSQPEVQQAFTSNVRAAQEAVGFTADEVNSFPDHRGLLVLDMLGKFLAQEKAGGPSPAARVVAKARKPMAPGAVTYKRTKAQKERRSVREKAQKTGDYRDVAKTLMVDQARN